MWETCGKHVQVTYPHLQCVRVNLVELVKVAEDNDVIRETILLAGGQDDAPRDLLTCG